MLVSGPSRDSSGSADAVLKALSILPLPVLYVVFGAAAFVARIVGWRRGYVRSGIARCLPGATEAERERVASRFYGYLGELVAEAVHGARISQDELIARLRFENEGVVAEALGDGKRVLLLTAHHCNWEWLLLRCSTAFGTPLVAAFKPASRERADVELTAMRSRFGATMVAAKQVVNHLVAQRGAVKLLALVADQSPAAGNEQQSWLDFFGTETGFFAGPGWISARMGYLPIYIEMRREGRGRYVARFVPLLAPGERADPQRTLEAYVRAVEASVRREPAWYFWAYNRWKRSRPVYG
jgi:Kdo2-lipid IVA lauroyltransferase/acyltransferase